MSLVTRLQAARNRAVMGGAALLAGMVAAPGAWAQCTDNFNFVGTNVPAVGGRAPVSTLVPLGTGSSLSAFISTINTINTAFLTQTTAFVSAPGNPAPDQQGGGVWVRGVGGSVEVKSTSTGVLDTSQMAGGVAPATGRQTCNTKVETDYAGYQVGHDISILNGAGTGANWHWGVTAGYLEARTKDQTSAGSFVNPNFPGITLTTPAGALSQETDVPFVGIYTAFTKGGFFLDGQVRWDFFQNQLTDRNNGLRGQELDAHGVSLTGNVGYNHALGGGWFIEPSGGVVWSRVSVNPLNVAGVQQTNGAFFFANGTVNVEDIESVLGRLSFRVGTNYTHAGVAWQPFFTASVFHEFEGDVHTTATTGGVLVGPPNPGLDGLRLSNSISRIETYGQFALGTAAAIINTGWLGYARVDYRTGEDIEGWSVNAGLRYQFTPGFRAAGMKDAPVPAVYAYNWTGPYIGAAVGALIWGHEDWRYTSNNATVEDLRFGGSLVGGQVGYNVQFGQTVIGIEADYAWTNAHGGSSCPNANLFTCEVEKDGIGSVTGRVGYAMGRALFYGKGGLAFGDVTLQTRHNAGLAVPPSNTPVNGSSETLVGYTVGGGMEFALTDRWSAKAEYMYYDLGNETFTVDNNLRVDADTRGSTVRIGVNLHLNPVQREVAPIK